MFWRLIDQARIGGTKPKDPSANEDALRNVLAKLPDEQVKEFGACFYRKLIELNRWDLWGAGYTACGGMGDDGFHYFRSWVIGKGEAAFRTALVCPDDLADFISSNDSLEDGLENEGLEYVAIEILETRGISDDPREGGSADDEPDGEPFDEDTVSRAYPRLSVIFDAHEAGSGKKSIWTWITNLFRR